MIASIGKNLICLLVISGLVVIHAISPAWPNSFVLSGDQMSVGVSSTGGLIDDSFTAGIIPTAFPIMDYLRPAMHFEFMSIGVLNGFGVGGYWTGQPYGSSNTTTNTSVDNILAAHITGYFNPFLFSTQNLWFEKSSNVIHFSVNFTNISNIDLRIVYARGLDPNQDYYPYGTGYTINTINTSGGYSSVTATGSQSQYYINLVDTSGGGVPEVDTALNFVNNGPYYALSNPQNYGNGDYCIIMAWDLGTLAPGNSVGLSFDYQIGAVPLPPTVLLLGSGLLGLVGWRRFRKS